MVKHIVLFKLKDEAPADKKADSNERIQGRYRGFTS